MLQGPPLADPVAIADILARGLDWHPDRIALASLERRWTWRELDADRSRLASSYRRLGLVPGDRLASLMPNSGALLVHYLACVHAGIVAVPLNYRYTPVEMDRALRHCGARALLHHAERDADVAASAEATRLALGRIVHGSVGAPSLVGLIEAGEPHAAPADLPAEAPAFILFTSGSTGPAKGVTHSRRSLAHAVASAAAGFEMSAADRVLPASSQSHLGSLLFSFGAYSVGARVLVARRFLPDEVLPLMAAERPTVLCMYPAALFGIVRDARVRRDHFASLRVVRSGGDKVPTRLEDELAALSGLAIDEAWGCTEAGLATMNPPSGRIVAGSIGQPLPGFELSLRDSNGREVATGADGVAFVRSRSVMAGYWGDAAATAQVLVDGWFDTGDVLRVDADGYLWFHGRKKQIIVHDSSNIFPQEVEDALLLHPAVAGAGVIGVHDLLHGENVRAYVELKAGRAAAVDELIAFARERVGYKAPEEVLFLDRVPLNATGKVDRPALQAMALAGH